MKIRNGFVSNSSSASFILDKRYITPEQIEEIKEFNKTCESEFWTITDGDDFVKGFTIMDNGALHNFIKENINPQMKAIVEWDKD
jgi:hypothetical protein